MCAVFQIRGIVLVLIERLKMHVRYLTACGPKCLRCLMLMPSGPTELLFFAFLMASAVSTVENWRG